MLRILSVLTLSILVIACSDDGQPPNPIVTPQPDAPTGSHTETQNQKIKILSMWSTASCKSDSRLKPTLMPGSHPTSNRLKHQLTSF